MTIDSKQTILDALHESGVRMRKVREVAQRQRNIDSGGEVGDAPAAGGELRQPDLKGVQPKG